MNLPDRRQFLRHSFTLGAGLVLAGSLPRLTAADAKTTQGAPRGFFTVAQRKGRWWLIQPDGRPFFSLGLNHIDPASLRYNSSGQNKNSRPFNPLQPSNPQSNNQPARLNNNL